MATDITEIKQRIEHEQRIRRISGGLGILAVLLITGLGMTYLGFLLADLVRQFGTWINFIGAFLKPNFVDFTSYTHQHDIGGLRAIWVSFTHPQYFVSTIANASVSSGSVLVSAAFVTILVGFCGTVIGFPLALVFGILGSERVTPFPFNFIFRGAMSTIRAVPALVWVLIYIPLTGINPYGAVLAIATDTIGNLGRLFTDELEEIDNGPIEAIRSTGAKRPQVVIFGMLSQVSNSFIAWTLYVLEINTRIAVSLGVVGAGGLGMYINLRLQTVSSASYARAAAGLVTVVVIVVTVELLSSRIRARLRPGEHERSGFFETIRGLGDTGRWLGSGNKD
ncbi:phosphate/phosphonate ABC transporter permease [Haladaptatus sp. T7]|uniref:phosphate/phosphonate ABC transporter permease n=1 Tax=Haladaptatus sp. T7 TaxID=2029368 RepID=UPI0021A25538|nr:phosphate/phosphonate ABC transporter permease [Haladaptatus sp. T7]GKZ13216.1 phosphonate ABC transporter, permease protein PhnE [Haladaptatus sp. T7]